MARALSIDADDHTIEEALSHDAQWIAFHAKYHETGLPTWKIWKAQDGELLVAFLGYGPVKWGVSFSPNAKEPHAAIRIDDQTMQMELF